MGVCVCVCACACVCLLTDFECSFVNVVLFLLGTSGLPACRVFVCQPGIWTGVSAAICRPATPTVVRDVGRIVSLVAGVSSLPAGIFCPYSQLRVQRGLSLGFAAPLRAAVFRHRLPVVSAATAADVVVGILGRRWPVGGVPFRTLSWPAGHLPGFPAVFPVWP